MPAGDHARAAAGINGSDPPPVNGWVDSLLCLVATANATPFEWGMPVSSPRPVVNRSPMIESPLVGEASFGNSVDCWKKSRVLRPRRSRWRPSIMGGCFSEG